MKNLLFKIFLILNLLMALFSAQNVSAQLTGVKTIPGDYATITAAVNALNLAGVGAGGIIFNIDPGFTETITTTISLTATGTAANPIVFQKDPDALGVNPLITAYTGGTGTPATAIQDGIWRLVGSDYVTIDGINLRDNPANTSNPATMEYGYALYKQSLSNGCQNVTIQNCTITLNKINNDAGTAPMVNGSVGILSVNSTAVGATTILIPTSAAGTNSNNSFFSNTVQNCNTGIAIIGYAATSPFSAADQNNDIGGSSANTGNTIVNFGGAPGALNPATGIRTLAQYEFNVSYNTLNNNNGSGLNHENILRGIYINLATSASANIANNTITLKGGGTTHQVTAIENLSGSTAVGNQISISNNTITNCSYSTSTTGNFYGIYNAGAPAILNINTNILTNNSSAINSTGVYYPIYNNGAATTTININDNSINGVTFTAATTAAFYGIYNLLGGTAANLSISNNNIKNINYSALSTAPNIYIINSAATLSQFISSNTFTNLNVNTTGSITIISNSVVVAATGNQVVDDNAIVGAFIRPISAASGALTLFSSSATSVSGSVISNSNNDFSNITVYGAATINGWVNTDAGASSKTIQGNIFSNWAGGTGTITALSVNLTGTLNATVANLVNNINSAGSITGISTVTGNDNIYSNTISNLSSTGSVATIVTGISVGAGTTKNVYLNTINNLTSAATTGSVNGITVAGSTTVNIYDNKIYTISGSALTTGSINGIWISAGTTVSVFRNKVYNIAVAGNTLTTGKVNGVQVSGSTASTSITLRNNILGDITAPAANSTEAIRGISLLSTGTTSNLNVYYNTIHLSASSAGANFGSSGIYHTINATATTAQLDLRNNIIHNISSANGTGLTVAYRRSGNNLSNYAVTSNNNLFYAGVPGTSMLIYNDGINSDQTLTAYATRMATRDAASVSESLTVGNKFLTTVGSSNNYLHMDDTKTSAVKGGAVNIAGIAVDFDNDIRQGNAGYAGTGSAPDIGADEYAGITYIPLTGSYNVGTGEVFTSLTNAGGLFAKINRVGLSGHLVVNITSDLNELGTEGLKEWLETGAGNYTLKIQPNNSTSRLISGDVLAGLIKLNGADRVLIDGGLTRSLTFRNTNTAGTTGTAFTFINGASNNIIRYCKIESFTNSQNAPILFSTSATYDGGNSNNLVEYCLVNGTVSGNTSIVSLLSAGTNVSGFENINNTLTNNSFYDYRDRGLEIKSTGSSDWNIIGNSFYNGGVSGAINYASGSTLHGIRILGGSGYVISNNYIGGSSPLANGAQAVYGNTIGNFTYQGILVTSNSTGNETSLKGNTIANISFSSTPLASSSATFYGIETNGAGINIGGNGVGEGNIIGSNSVNGSIVITTSTGTNTYTSLIRGIFCNSKDGLVNGNQVSGININNQGTAAAASIFLGIFVNFTSAPSQVKNNTIGSSGVGALTNSIQVVAASKATATSLTGISIGSSVGSTVEVSGNKIKNFSHLSTATIVSGGGIIGISSAAKATAEISILNNFFENNSNTSTMTTGLLYGVQNTGATGTVRINNNTFINNTINSATSVYNAIRNSGAIFNTIEINGNTIGNAVNPAITFSGANSGAQIFIANTGGAPTSDLSISNNNFQNINYAINGSGANTFISNTAATLTQTIEGNSFINLNPQTSGSNTFITNSVIVQSAGSQTISNNTITGTYSKRAGGTVTFLTSAATCAAGSTVNINNNNFSNVTVTGTTVINGIVNTDAGNSNKTIQGNNLTNWSGGTSTLTGMNISLTGIVNATTGNVIRNITGTGTVVGVTTAGGNDNIYLNTIDSLYSTGGIASNVTGIAVTSGTSKNIYKNIISNIWGTTMTTGSVRGILVSGGTTVSLSQNTISTLYANTLTTGTVSGIWASGGTTISVNRNKIYDIAYTGTALTAAIYGIQVSGNTVNSAYTLNNNLVGDLRTPTLSNTDAIRGIGIVSSGNNSAISVYYNTIFLNATSTGTNFGTSGIYHATSATATTAALDIRNNNITNSSSPRGTGKTVAYRRSTTALNNYAAASNNNMYYGGTPGVNNLIFFDGTNSDQTIVAFKTRVLSREINSVSEDLIAGNIFLSTTGTSTFFLHIDLNKTTTLKSGAVQISGFIDDFDGDVRFGNAGYAGNGSAPDIGADEFTGYQIQPFSGVINVGNGQNYTSLTNSNGLFSKINSLGFSGNVSVNITSDLTETGAEALNQWTETSGSGYSLSIQPDATTPRLISGNSVAGLIRFNGADRVKIDGNTGKYLTFRNTNTTGTSGTAFTFFNGATYDTIRNCNIEAFANATNGVILFSNSTSVASGNSNNLIEYNNIRGTVGLNTSNTCIYSAGTAGKENANITIANNKIYDFKDRAIEITTTGSSRWTISGNSMYNGNVSGGFNYDAASILHGVRILGGAGYTITNNHIGGSDTLTKGAAASYSSTLGNISYKGITLTTTSSSPASNIKGNVISMVSVNSIPQSAGVNSFMGIESIGQGINIGGTGAGEGNLIGSNTISNAIVITTTTSSAAYTSAITGINCLSSGGEIIANQVGGITIENKGADPAPSFFKGIYVNNALVPSKVNNNTIGSNGTGAASNSIHVLATSTALTNTITGIELGTSVANAVQMDRNMVSNISNLSNNSSGSFTGINNSATLTGAAISITNSKIININTAANSDINSGVYAGILSNSASTITNDTITNINYLANGISAQIKGIQVSGAYVNTISDNWLYNFSTASVKVADAETGTPSGFTVVGILNSASVSGQVVSGNTLYNFYSTTAENTNTAVLGIGVVTTGNGGAIFKNRISRLFNSANGTIILPGVTGIMAYNGSYSVYNNAIKIDNIGNSNGLKIYGINHATTNAWNYFYNSVKIGGNVLTTSARTSGFVRTVNGTVTLKNNLLVNDRSGIGNHFAISNKVATPSTNWSASTSNYNNLYSSNVAFTAEWGNGVNNSIVQWRTNSGGDNNSVSSSVSFITSPYDLVLESRSNCAINNAGTPIIAPVSISTDLNNESRHATTPDIGAYEFSYIPFIVSASSNSPVCASSMISLYSLSGNAISPSYSWSTKDSIGFSTNSNTNFNAVSGYYLIRVTDINGCSVSDSTLVTATPVPNATVNYAAAEFCPGGGFANVNVSGTMGGYFTSTTGLLIDSANGSVNLVNSTPGNYTIKYYIPAGGGCTFFQTTTALKIIEAGTWTGAINTDWHTGGNWICGTIPATGSTIIIPGSLTNYPLIGTSNATVKNITVNAGASLTVNAQFLQVAETIANNGTLVATNGTIEMKGTLPQVIAANTFASNTIKSLTINNAAGVTLEGQLNITDVLTITNGSLATGDSLTLKSTETTTAMVAAITSLAATPIVGKVTIERYIPARRAWRLMGAPISSTGAPTFNAAWQEGATSSTSNFNPGFGAHITGGTVVNGFDQSPTNSSNLKYFLANSWQNIPNTNTTPVTQYPGYLFFIRGDRSYNISSSTVLAPTATVLRVSGNLNHGTQPSVPVAATGFTLVSNPYASPVSLGAIIASGTNIKNRIYVWDPSLGGTNGLGAYVILDWNGSTYTAVPTSLMTSTIQAGQAFFVQSDNGMSAGSMVLSESHKVSTTYNAPFGRGTNADVTLKIDFKVFNADKTITVADGVMARFNNNYSNEVNNEDALKRSNINENFAIVNKGILLTIERRSMPTAADTMVLNTSALKNTDYQLEIVPGNFERTGLSALLYDLYNKTLSPISNNDTTRYTFTVTSDALSKQANRFNIVYSNASILPVTITSVKATATGPSSVQVEWDVMSEQNISHYEVEKFNAANNFKSIGKVQATAGGTAKATYHFADAAVAEGDNLYRIKSIGFDGQLKYSAVVKVIMKAKQPASITAYPNPVTNATFTLALSNMEKGPYTADMYNTIGQKVFSQTFNHPGANASHTFTITSTMAKGIYQLQVINNGQIKQTISLNKD